MPSGAGPGECDRACVAFPSFFLYGFFKFTNRCRKSARPLSGGYFTARFAIERFAATGCRLSRRAPVGSDKEEWCPPDMSDVSRQHGSKKKKKNARMKRFSRECADPCVLCSSLAFLFQLCETNSNNKKIAVRHAGSADVVFFFYLLMTPVGLQSAFLHG